MSHLPRRLHKLLLALTLTASPPLLATPGLELSFGEDQLVVHNASPGGEVLVAHAFLSLTDQITTQAHGLEVLLADATGQVALEPAPQVAGLVLYLAIDISSGTVATLAEPAERQLPIGVRAAASDASALRFPLQRGYAVLMRPAVGAWSLLSADGGPDDADGVVNGFQVLTLSVLERAAGPGGSPATAAIGDRVAILDLEAMTLGVEELDDKALEYQPEDDRQ